MKNFLTKLRIWTINHAQKTLRFVAHVRETAEVFLQKEYAAGCHTIYLYYITFSLYSFVKYIMQIIIVKYIVINKIENFTGGGSGSIVSKLMENMIKKVNYHPSKGSSYIVFHSKISYS